MFGAVDGYALAYYSGYKDGYKETPVANFPFGMLECLCPFNDAILIRYWIDGFRNGYAHRAKDQSLSISWRAEGF